MDKRPQHTGPGGAQAQALLLSGDIHRRLRKGARDRHTKSYRQYTDVVNGSYGRQGKTGILDTFPRKGRVLEQ